MATARIEPVPSIQTLPTTPPAIGLTENHLRESIARNAPGTLEALDRFMALAADHGVFLEAGRKSLMIKWRGPDDVAYSLDGVTSVGEFISYPANWSPDGLGRIDLAHEYLDSLAKLVSGVVRKFDKPASWYVVKSGTELPSVMDVLAKQEAWLTLIDAYTAKLRDAIAAREA